MVIIEKEGIRGDLWAAGGLYDKPVIGIEWKKQGQSMAPGHFYDKPVIGYEQGNRESMIPVTWQNHWALYRCCLFQGISQQPRPGHVCCRLKSLFL